MNWLKNNLANLFTSGNLLCGFIGIVMVLQGPVEWAFWMMLLAALLDFLDGFVARLTKTTSKIGADLDSLADMVTFGVLPGIMVYTILPCDYNWLAALIPIISAWRLAKFNNDQRPSGSFYGLPTPANAICLGGLFAADQYWSSKLDGLNQWIDFSQIHVWVIPYLILSSYLMVSNVKLLSNKISGFNLSKYKWHLIVLVIGTILILFFGYLGISLAIISYVLISIFATFASPKIAE